MKQLAYLLFAFVIVFTAQPYSAKAQDAFSFFQTIEDLPIMPGLYELTESAVLFDKAEGRIAESTAASANFVGVDDIKRFYEQTLPQLGWQARSPGIYTREDERLKMSLNQNQGYQYVHFSVSPQ